MSAMVNIPTVLINGGLSLFSQVELPEDFVGTNAERNEARMKLAVHTAGELFLEAVDHSSVIEEAIKKRQNVETAPNVVQPARFVPPPRGRGRRTGF